MPPARLVRQAALLVEDSGDLPRGFVAALFGRAASEDLVVYSAQEIAALARASFDHLQKRVPGVAERARVESAAGRRHQAARSDHRRRDLQRRHAVSARFGAGRNRRARAERCASWCIRCSPSSGTRPASSSPGRARRPSRPRSSAKASSTFMSSASIRSTPPRWSGALQVYARRSARRRRRLEEDARGGASRRSAT